MDSVYFSGVLEALVVQNLQFNYGSLDLSSADHALIIDMENETLLLQV